MVIAIFKNYICHFLLTGKNICKMPYSMNAFQDSQPESHQLSRVTKGLLQLMDWKEGNVLFNDALNTFNYSYMVSDI